MYIYFMLDDSKTFFFYVRLGHVYHCVASPLLSTTLSVFKLRRPIAVVLKVKCFSQPSDGGF